MTALSNRTRTAFIVVVLLVVLISAQAAATALAPAEGRSATGEVLGRTGFAFLGGMRTFAAAVLWNRLDPISDGYYVGSNVAGRKFMLPSLRIITALDPQFVQAYYYAAYALAASDDAEAGVELAREGVSNNPTSGLMRANLVQLLMMQDKTKNLQEMIRESKVGLKPEMRYDNADDAFESLAIYRTAFVLNGDEETVARITETLEELRASGQIAQDHDHDHDGEQDH